MDIGVEFMDNEFHKCKSYSANKLKAYLHSKGHFANTINEKVFLDFIFPIMFIGYDGLKGYIF